MIVPPAWKGRAMGQSVGTDDPGQRLFGRFGHEAVREESARENYGLKRNFFETWAYLDGAGPISESKTAKMGELKIIFRMEKNLHNLPFE